MPYKKTPGKTIPDALNVSELARYYGTSRNTVQSTISRGQLTADTEGRYDVWKFEHAVAEHCPKLIEDFESDAAAWRRFMHFDVHRYAWRRKLEERGYDVSS